MAKQSEAPLACLKIDLALGAGEIQVVDRLTAACRPCVKYNH